MSEVLEVRVRFAVDDAVLSDLHGRAFGSPWTATQPWAQRLERHSVGPWVGGFAGPDLVGFVHACWDGGAHAFLLDTVVDPRFQRRGIGRRLVDALVTEVTAAGCQWLHVDYEPHLDGFYRGCGFRPTAAGLVALSAASGR